VATAVLRTTRLARGLLRLLPAPLTRALDAWSHRLAMRRAEQRRQRWQQRQAARSAL
jgi:hypothetical protein